MSEVHCQVTKLSIVLSIAQLILDFGVSLQMSRGKITPEHVSCVGRNV